MLKVILSRHQFTTDFWVDFWRFIKPSCANSVCLWYTLRNNYQSIFLLGQTANFFVRIIFARDMTYISYCLKNIYISKCISKVNLQKSTSICSLEIVDQQICKPASLQFDVFKNWAYMVVQLWCMNLTRWKWLIFAEQHSRITTSQDWFV